MWMRDLAATLRSVNPLVIYLVLVAIAVFVALGAMIAARVKRLVYGANDPKGGADGGAFDILRSRDTNHRIDVEAGVLHAETSARLQQFFQHKRGNHGPEGIEPAAP